MTSGRPSARARLVLWSPVVLALAYEFYLSSQSVLPALPFSDLLPNFDKVAHAGYFFLTGLLAVRAARYCEAWSGWRTATILLLGTLGWGILDEFHQSFVPCRSVEAADVAADVAGALLAVLAGGRIWRLTRLDRVVP